MRTFLLFWFGCLLTIAHAQQGDIHLVFKDAETQAPIEDVTVTVLRTKQNYISNPEGRVSFALKGVSSIQIAHSSYESQSVRSTALKLKENVIFLKSAVNTLDEIVITKQHPQKILKGLIENSVDKLTTPCRLKVYSREFFKRNGNYMFYNDGLLHFQISGKNKDFKNDILVEQNRSIGLVDADVSQDLLGYDLNNIMGNYYNFKYLEPLLEARARKDYDFLIKSYTKNDNYYVMVINPLDPVKGFKDDYTILYDKKKKIILEVSSSVTPNAVANAPEKRSVGARNLYKSNYKNIYRYAGDQEYYLLSSREEIGFERVDKKDVRTEIEVRNYFITTGFSRNEFSFKESEIFKDKALFNLKDKILTDYWNVSGLLPTPEEEAIIKNISDEP
ncbi:hypothetical protein [Flavobacterium sp.]|jgi:hypothetical protein|uniref:hypothetical protein n=1 Tax=Flavobacterium sp. TaxID=239 RepID=UPI0022C6C528|nr:hypothetical protein [Flavobacterium sp.]MCZ8143702.1 hypothetical protein [Flavobacterium sp.]MCZ8366965.1 hypothetical protein [Flavobacterium sp.]